MARVHLGDFEAEGPSEDPEQTDMPAGSESRLWHRVVGYGRSSWIAVVPSFPDQDERI